MLEPIRIRFGGYSPPETSHSRAVVRFAEALARRTGGAVQTDKAWNVMDFGYGANELLWLTESGVLTMCYFSTAYLAERVPELAVVDLPFIFEDLDHAHAALDGELGAFLTERTESRLGYRVLGYWDNGFRHLSNRLRPVHTPADLKGMRVRLQLNDIHARTFRLLGAEPVPTDLKPGIAMIASGEVDAQENPLSNTMTYGVHKVHRHVTLTGTFYGARGIYAHKATFDGWPADLQQAIRESVREAILFQRKAAEEVERDYRREMEKMGIAFVDLTPAERGVFQKAVAPILEEAKKELGGTILALAAKK
ncbi:MAG: TRAP transporter substrate-binding protein [Candidatus Tectomicrobia bacterium]|nr:TRAP transporter substrate-binding protein [Candidatus Tectomicrobia bacterium]